MRSRASLICLRDGAFAPQTIDLSPEAVSALGGPLWRLVSLGLVMFAVGVAIASFSANVESIGGHRIPDSARKPLVQFGRDRSVTSQTKSRLLPTADNPPK